MAPIVVVPLNKDRLLMRREVADRLHVSPKTLDKLVRRGIFPRPIRWSRKLVRWKESTVDDYLANLEPAPDGPPEGTPRRRRPGGRHA